jgi:hypothetical protein
VFALELQMSAAAADGGWTLGAFVYVNDGVDGKSGAVAFVKHMSVVKGGDPPPPTAPKLSRTLSKASALATPTCSTWRQ